MTREMGIEKQADKLQAVWVVGSKKEAAFIVPLCRALESQGIRIRFVTDFGSTYTFLKKAGQEAVLIPMARKRAMGLEEAKATVKRYPIINNIIKIEDSLKRLKHEDALIFSATYFLFWEQFLKKHQVQTVLSMGTRGLAGRSCIAIAKEQGMGTLEFLGGSKPYGNFVITDNGDLAWMWSELKTRYEATKDTAIDDKLRERVNTWISQWQECRRQLRHTFVERARKRSFFSAEVRAKAGLFFNAIVDDLLRRDFSLPWHAYERDVAFRKAFADNYNRRHTWHSTIKPFVRYDYPVQGERFVVFPLYAETDMPLNVSHEFLHDQVAMVKVFAEALPEGYKLYVKQHPYGLGDFSVSQLQQMQINRNVSLIDPGVDNLTLVNGASAIINIGSTSGYEAFLLRKPVIVVTKPFYAYCDIVYYIDSPSMAQDVIRDALEKGERIYTQKEAHWFHMVEAIFTTVYTGEIWDYKPNWGSTGISAFDPSNIQMVASVITDKIRRSLIKTVAVVPA